MRTSSNEYRIVNGESILWNGFDYVLQCWIFEGKKDVRTLAELQQAIAKKKSITTMELSRFLTGAVHHVGNNQKTICEK